MEQWPFFPSHMSGTEAFKPEDLSDQMVAKFASGPGAWRFWITVNSCFVNCFLYKTFFFTVTSGICFPCTHQTWVAKSNPINPHWVDKHNPLHRILIQHQTPPRNHDLALDPFLLGAWFGWWDCFTPALDLTVHLVMLCVGITTVPRRM